MRKLSTKISARESTLGQLEMCMVASTRSL